MKLRNSETDNYITTDKSDSEYTVIDSCSVTTIESNITSDTSDDSKISWSPSSNDSNKSSDDCNTSIDTSDDSNQCYDDSNQSSEVCNLNNEFSNVGNNSIVSNVDHPCKLDAINNSIRKNSVIVS